MQVIAPVTNADLLAAGQRPLMKLEIMVGGVPIDISNLGGKNYLKDISFSSGGARMAPNPIAGEFSAVISNEGNIFHPNHPTSPYATYFRAGREVMISLGGNYAIGGIKLWQRIVGFMDEPELATDTFELTIKGLDYMKVLSDMKFTKEVSAFAATPIDNYWGALQVSNSVSSAGSLGPELYAENDCMDTGAVGVEGNNIGGWAIILNGATTFTSQPQIGGFSNWEARFVCTPAGLQSAVEDANVCNITLGNQYFVTFKYIRIAGTDSLRAAIRQGVVVQGHVAGLSSNVWADGSFYFTALSSGAAAMSFSCKMPGGGSTTFRIDNISIKQVTAAAWHRYPMPATCTGIYYVELDEGSGFQAVWPGKQKGEGWYYDAENQYFYFDEDKGVDAGVANLRIYYYTAQAPENVLADLLAKAGLYANRALALADMGGPVTGVSVDRVWFKDGSAYIDAIKKICERSEPSGWRFYFDWNGKPVFVPAPVAGVPVFTTFNPQHFTSPRLYQDRNEIRNRIVIEGEKRAELTGWEDNMPSELKDEASDPGSITAYGEHTKSIKNHLFQTQASITAMCATLLAAYKNPKWYFDYDTPYNAVPLVLGDTVLVQELLDIVLPVAQRYITHNCLIRDANVSRYNVTYKCEMVGGCMLIPPEGDVEEKWEDASESDRMYAYVGNCDANSFVSDGSPLKIVCECE